MAQGPSVTRHDTHSTTNQAHGWSTKRISITALFCAVAAIATLFLEFPILPGLIWLKYDPEQEQHSRSHGDEEVLPVVP